MSNADVALSVARERASTARAPLPRILATIDQHAAALATIDSRISDAPQAVADRERERDLWNGKRAYVAALDAIRDAVQTIEHANEEMGLTIRATLEREGLRTFDKAGHLDDLDRLLVDALRDRGRLASLGLLVRDEGAVGVVFAVDDDLRGLDDASASEASPPAR